MEKNTKIVLWVLGIGALLGVGYFSYKKLTSKGKDSKKDDSKSSKNGNKADEEVQYAGIMEAEDLIVSAIRLKDKTGKDNFLSRLQGSDEKILKIRSDFKKQFRNNVTMKEYNVIKKFLDSFDKNETNTISKLTDEEKNTLKSGMSKIKKILNIGE